MLEVFLAAALAAVSPASENAQIDKAEAALRSPMSDPAAYDAAEKVALALAGSRAWHEKGALVLVLDDGKRLRLPVPGCEREGCASYRLAAFLPSRGVFVVQAIVVEGYDFVLVETANGRQHEIDGPPHYSPDGQRFVTCRVDEMNGGGSAIWHVVPGRYVREWQDDRMSECGRWKSNSAVEVGIYDDVPTGKPHPVTVSREGDRWQLRQGADVLKARP